MKTVNGIFGSIVVSAAALIAPTIVNADTVSLTFEEQGFTVVGELQRVTDTAYVVMTEQGQFTIPFSYVTCEGAACPEAQSSAES